jgi:hypothetical protein
MVFTTGMCSRSASSVTAADSPGTGQDHRVLCLADQLPGGGNVGGVGVKVVQLLTLQRHGISGHLGNVLGQVDVGGTGFALFGVLEGQPHDLAHRVRTDDLLGALCDGLKHGGQIQVLMAGQLHPVGAHLPGNGHQRCTVQIGICHAGDKVGGTGAKGGKAYAGPAGQAAIDIGHKGSALLVTHRDEPDMAVADGKHQIQRLLAGDAEHHVHAFRFQTVHKDLCGRFLFFLHGMFTLLFLENRKKAVQPVGATLPLQTLFYRFWRHSTRANFHKKCRVTCSRARVGTDCCARNVRSSVSGQ